MSPAPASRARLLAAEVLGDPDRRIGELAREGQGEELAVRLVRRPEAGCRS